jgi:hypothetical protein
MYIAAVSSASETAFPMEFTFDTAVDKPPNSSLSELHAVSICRTIDCSEQLATRSSAALNNALL